MAYSHKETVEISSKEEGFLGSYHRAKILAAIGRTRYLVQYQNRYHPNDNKKLLITAVDDSDVRPLPPQVKVPSFSLTDRVDACINEAWWVGEIVIKVHPSYVVRLESNGKEHDMFFYKLRLHLDWVDGNWVYPRNGIVMPQNDDKQAKPSKQGS